MARYIIALVFILLSTWASAGRPYLVFLVAPVDSSITPVSGSYINVSWETDRGDSGTYKFLRVVYGNGYYWVTSVPRVLFDEITFIIPEKVFRFNKSGNLNRRTVTTYERSWFDGDITKDRGPITIRLVDI